MFCKIKNVPLYLFQLTDVLSVHRQIHFNQLQWIADVFYLRFR